MFSIKLLEGNPDIALSEPNSVAINATLKDKYFSDGSAVGETIEIFDESFKVAAVFEDVSTHSHFRPNFLVSMAEFCPEDRRLPDGSQKFFFQIALDLFCEIPSEEAAQ